MRTASGSFPCKHVAVKGEEEDGVELEEAAGLREGRQGCLRQ